MIDVPLCFASAESSSERNSFPDHDSMRHCVPENCRLAMSWIGVLRA